MIRISNIKLSVSSGEEKLAKKIATVLKIKPAEILSCQIIKKAVDARNKNDICFVYTADVEIENEGRFFGIKNVSHAEKLEYKPNKTAAQKYRPVVIGSGPAGLFAALVLAEAGLNPIIIERGKPVEERRKDVDLFWKTGKLDTASNVQFGEGGAGAFSDGKLTTGINDFRMAKVIDEFVESGAPDEIRYLSKPHIGTDKLFFVLQNMRNKIISLGGEYRFNTLFTGFRASGGKLDAISLKNIESGEEYELECDYCIMAIGHSARDTFEMLRAKNIEMAAKPFSVGVRIEHRQEMINKAQYGKFWNHEALGAADYKLNCKANGRGVYTFCMCPGGLVVAAASEEKRLVVNGMSYFARNLENANSALLVNVNPADLMGDDPFKCINFQRELEEKAFELGGSNYFAPVQLAGDFLKGITSKEFGSVEPSYKPGVTMADLNLCLPEFVAESLKIAIKEMAKRINGFDSYDAVLTAVESRSSSPVRILRDAELNCAVAGLIPCGEGAGYAGGIMSACVDGIKCGEKLINS